MGYKPIKSPGTLMQLESGLTRCQEISQQNSETSNVKPQSSKAYFSYRLRSHVAPPSSNETNSKPPNSRLMYTAKKKLLSTHITRVIYKILQPLRNCHFRRWWHCYRLGGGSRTGHIRASLGTSLGTPLQGLPHILRLQVTPSISSSGHGGLGTIDFSVPKSKTSSA